MAIAVTLTNPRRNHALVTATIGAVTTWQTITFPAWVRRFEVINYGADSVFLTTEAADGDAGTGGVELPANASYSAPAGGPDGPFIAIRHASGSYTFGLALTDAEGV